MEFWLGGDIEKVKNMDNNVKLAIELILQQASLIVQNNAKENAPYLTWTLRRSITHDWSKVSRWYAIIWSPVAYARKREYENNRNPDRKYYLKRWYTEHEREIKDLVKKYLTEKLK